MENPGYALARQVFLAAGAEVVPVAVDREGLRTEGLPAARLAYVTPSHQFPLGGVLPAGRRRELLAWARRNGAHVDRGRLRQRVPLRHRPDPALQALDEAGRVIYLGTVSKTLSPTLRLGYLVVPAALSLPFAKAKRLADRHTPSLEQEALADADRGAAPTSGTSAASGGGTASAGRRCSPRWRRRWARRRRWSAPRPGCTWSPG